MKHRMKKAIHLNLLAILLASCGSSSQSSNEADLLAIANRNFKSVMKSGLTSDDPKVILGEALFFEKNLSFDKTISCATCHDPKKFGVDNLRLSKGVNGVAAKRNSPTILNAHFQSAQFWDGRASTLEEQVRMPMLADAEMAMPSEEVIINRISSLEQYEKPFAQIYPDSGVTMNSISNAIATYIESLTLPSRFDDFLDGKEVLTNSEKNGMKAFIEIGCADCHNGQLLGDGFEEFGIFGNYWKYTNSQKIDSGRVIVTKSSDDLFVFKVPSLRNVTETYPYFHDGSVQNLENAVRIMAEVQLDRSLSDKDVADIISFLKTLRNQDG